MSNGKRLYESPRLVTYGHLAALTKGSNLICPPGQIKLKAYGSGDDLSQDELQASSTFCYTP